MENSGGWKNIPSIRRKTPPQKRFWTPHLQYVSPPFFGDSLSFPFKKEAPTRPTPISEASKSGFGEHALQYVFPPKIHAIRFAPPLSCCPLCSTILKGYCAIWGGISHRAAKIIALFGDFTFGGLVMFMCQLPSPQKFQNAQCKVSLGCLFFFSLFLSQSMSVCPPRPRPVVHARQARGAEKFGRG